SIVRHPTERHLFRVLSRLQKHSSLAKPRQRNAPKREKYYEENISTSALHRPLVSLATPLVADTIRLKDGSVIRGTVIGFKDQQFTILIGSNARGRRGQTTVYVEDVESIEFDSNTGGGTATEDMSARNNPPAMSRPTNPNPQPDPDATDTRSTTTPA